MAAKKKARPATPPPITDRDRFLELCGVRDKERAYVRERFGRIDVYLRGLYRMFASWFDEGLQRGVHLRSADPKQVRSTMFRGDHNWIYLMKPTWDALPALIAESRRISELRGGGQPLGAVLDVYKPLAKAIEGAIRPPADLHAGGPRAKVLSGEQEVATALCEACMKRVSHLTHPGDDKLLARLKGLIAKGDLKYEILWPAANALPYGAESAKRAADAAESAVVQAARAVLGCQYGSQKCLPFVTKALVRTVKEVEEAEGPEAAAAFIVELDELIMRHEFIAAYAAKTKSDAPAFERVLWRGADAKGFPAWWLVRLERGSYGMLGKLGGRWGWYPGDRDNTLAMIPDEHFEAAVTVALARDGA